MVRREAVRNNFIAEVIHEMSFERCVGVSLNAKIRCRKVRIFQAKEACEQRNRIRNTVGSWGDPQVIKGLREVDRGQIIISLQQYYVDIILEATRNNWVDVSSHGIIKFVS